MPILLIVSARAIVRNSTAGLKQQEGTRVSALDIRSFLFEPISNSYHSQTLPSFSRETCRGHVLNRRTQQAFVATFAALSKKSLFTHGRHCNPADELQVCNCICHSQACLLASPPYPPPFPVHKVYAMPIGRRSLGLSPPLYHESATLSEGF